MHGLYIAEIYNSLTTFLPEGLPMGVSSSASTQRAPEIWIVLLWYHFMVTISFGYSMCIVSRLINVSVLIVWNYLLVIFFHSTICVMVQMWQLKTWIDWIDLRAPNDQMQDEFLDFAVNM